MGPGQHLDGLGQLRVPSHRPVPVAVGAHQVGEHLGAASSDLAPEVAWRSRSRLTENGSTAQTSSPAATKAPTKRPRSVSIATATSAGSAAWAATSSWNRRTPSTPSGSRRLPSVRPASSLMATSWWASAQSTPTKITRYLLLVDTDEPEETSGALMDQCSKHAIPPAVPVLLAGQRGTV